MPGVIEWQTPPNNALKGKVRVRFNRCAAWMESKDVRVMILDDYRRIHGQRFCDWQYQLWYTLIFRYAQSFETLDRDQFKAYWQAGWSAGATAKRLAADHRWKRFPLGAPSYAHPFIAEFGDEPDDAMTHSATNPH